MVNRWIHLFLPRCHRGGSQVNEAGSGRNDEVWASCARLYKTIVRELVETVRNNVTIDWTVKESIRAKLRVMVKRVLRKYGYPPDKQEKATQTVLEQAELLCKDFSQSWQLHNQWKEN